MKPPRVSIAVAALLCAACAHRAAPIPSTFALHEMDMHLHCGLERPIALDKWIDIAARDGRKVIVMLDHLELYRKTPAEYYAWLAEKKFPRWYPVGAEGHRAFMNDLNTVIAARPDLHLFRGWEIYEGELDTGIEEAPMRMADVIGWHISPNNGREAPNGQTLIKRAKQVRELQKEFPIPMILFHPFTMRIENLQKTAKANGRDISAITVDEYRFFQPGEQEELARILKGLPIYIEIGKTTGTMWLDPVVRESFIKDIKPLADMGVQFTVSTDNHYMIHTQQKFQPDVYCSELGITTANTNTIVHELIAQRRNSAKQ
ncbi:MAG: hypothetical protein IT366_23240 [Candidatus Hydrogenedentes bacterium]|nr:hypothetical protein [Candidatus Hydrogenedentota bacterium]